MDAAFLMNADPGVNSGFDLSSHLMAGEVLTVREPA